MASAIATEGARVTLQALSGASQLDPLEMQRPSAHALTQAASTTTTMDQGPHCQLEFSPQCTSTSESDYPQIMSTRRMLPSVTCRMKAAPLRLPSLLSNLEPVFEPILSRANVRPA